MWGTFVAFVALLSYASALKDADKAAEISREIRELYRASGMNWISPKMMESIDLDTNQKPIMYLFTLRSCFDCRRMLDQFKERDHSLNSQISAMFHSVLVLDDYALDFGRAYDPSGQDGIPRVLFADPDGQLRYDLKNAKSDKDEPYFYNSAEEVIGMMRKVLSIYRQDEIDFSETGITYPSDLEYDLPS